MLKNGSMVPRPKDQVVVDGDSNGDLSIALFTLFIYL